MCYRNKCYTTKKIKQEDKYFQNYKAKIGAASNVKRWNNPAERGKRTRRQSNAHADTKHGGCKYNSISQMSMLLYVNVSIKKREINNLPMVQKSSYKSNDHINFCSDGILVK